MKVRILIYCDDQEVLPFPSAIGFTPDGGHFEFGFYDRKSIPFKRKLDLETPRPIKPAAIRRIVPTG